ncbi:hypothetical protein [Staphylococcus nepalensis]|uniref:hypothetical protein n=1 Tax=Staphylococcus nepalensis TaxID=214473 RepID=UPI003EE510F7
MDKEILNYLDNVGQYLQGAGEKGFETYVHGVWVSSLIYGSLGLLLLIIGIVFFITFANKKILKENEEFIDREKRAFGIGLLIIFGLLGTVIIMYNSIGIFAPDYVAIKEISESIGGKK